MSEKESIIEKVRKLLRLAERAGTPEESQAAFARASELLYKYKIDRSEVGSVDEKREIAEEYADVEFNLSWNRWALNLCRAIANNFACEPFTNTPYPVSRPTIRRIGFIGWKEDVSVACVVFANAFSFVMRRIHGQGLSRSERDMWALGFVDGLREKFEEIRRSHEKFAIVMKPPKEATDKTKTFKGKANLKYKSAQTYRDLTAFERGQQAGKEFNPHSTINGQCVRGALQL